MLQKFYKPLIQKGLLALVATTGVMVAQSMQSGGGGMGGFGGPAVLGRGAGATTGQRGGADLGLSFFAGAMGTYDSGLSGLRLDADGNLQSLSAAGVDAFAGVTGSKRLKRGSLGLNYSGHYRQYSNGTYMNGTDQQLSLFTSRQINRRSTFSFTGSVLTTNRPFGAGFGMLGNFANSVATIAPSNDLFDNRVYFANGGVEYIVQKSARTSFAISSNGFITRRTGAVLFGSNGNVSSANVAYRISRRQTVSFGYNYLFFNYTRNFGDTHGHGAFGGYSVQLGRRAQLATQFGVTRIESLGLRRAQIDPVIAALIGFSTVDEVFHSVSFLPFAAATLNYRVSRFHDFNVTATNQISPGNGVVNTSRNTGGGAGYNYSGIRNWGLGGSVAYNRLSSLIAGNQIFESITSSAMVSRNIGRDIYFTSNFGNRRFLSQATTNNFRRSSIFLTVGLTWSPREVPISIR